MNFQNKRIGSYKEGGFAQIEGWVVAQVLQVIDILDTVPFNKQGGIAEIGVHHGLMYILLNQVTELVDQSYAIDVFNNQHLNIDNSGKGWLEKFTENLSKYDAHNGKNTNIIIGDSTDAGLNLRQTIGLGKLRMLSIDGGHTVEHTINDLHLANDLISNSGVVIVDDIMNPAWPGVIEGVCRFLIQSPTLVPFSIGGNKLYMCKLSYHKPYFELMASTSLSIRQVKFFSHTIVQI